MTTCSTRPSCVEASRLSPRRTACLPPQLAALPERHLGLVPTAEGGVGDDFFERLAAQAEQTLDLDGILALARELKDSGSSLTEGVPTAPDSHNRHSCNRSAFSAMSNLLSIQKPQATEPAFLSSTKDCSCSSRGALPFGIDG